MSVHLELYYQGLQLLQRRAETGESTFQDLSGEERGERRMTHPVMVEVRAMAERETDHASSDGGGGQT